MDKHDKSLQNMCRVCTNRAQTKAEISKRKPVRYVKDHVDSIRELYGLDCSNDDTRIHPQKICSSCYQTLTNSKHRGGGGMKTDGKYHQLATIAVYKNQIWKVHVDNACEVCNLYVEQGSSGGPKKKKNSGTIKLQFNLTVNDIFADEFSADIVDKKLDFCDLHNMTDKQKMKFKCGICSTVLPYHSVTTDCHNFCSDCLSNVFKSCKQNDIVCPQCLQSVTYSNVRANNVAFRSILSDLILKCNICQCIKEYNQMIDHKCSPPTTPHTRRETSASSCTAAIQTTPSTVPISLKSDPKAPATKEEERVHSHLARKQLNFGKRKGVIRLKTRGQPIYLMQIRKPRVPSAKASSSLKKARARQMAKFRENGSGSGESWKEQQSSELKLLSKETKLEICNKAGVKRKVAFAACDQLALKTNLRLSCEQERKLKRFMKKQGIEYENEQKERALRTQILQNVDLQSKNISLYHPYSKKQMIQKPSASVWIQNICEFVNERLEQYENAGDLDINKFPDQEIFVKFGCDHGQNSFKASLSVLNIANPNSQDNTVVVGCFEAKDYYENLPIFLSCFTSELEQLDGSKWKGYTVRLFIYGDYAFLCAAYGISGAAAIYPCLWCHMNKSDFLKPDMSATERSLSTLRRDFSKFCKYGRKKLSVAKQYNNVIHKALFPVKLTKVCPPYLHILLGIVKFHHDLLKKDCHEIDKSIALDLAKKEVPDSDTEPFAIYVKQLRRQTLITEEVKKLQGELSFTQQDEELTKTKKESLLSAIKKRIKDLNELSQKISSQAVLEECYGPVCANLKIVLKKNNIIEQKYHNNSFTGNHCAKYLKVYGELMSSIDNKTKELTSNKTIQRTAQHVCRRYSKLNKYFGKLHERVSHTQPVSNEEIQEADSCIKKYVSKFRQYNPDHFTPKPHMLEHHIIPWMKRYGFGMALFGEQGGESCHRQLKFYMNRMMFIPNNVKRLTAVMREHIVSTHPQTNLHIPRPKKRKSANEDC